MKHDDTFRMKAYRAHVAEIPPEKWGAKLRRFGVGMLLLAGAVGAVIAKLDVPWQAHAAVLVFAGYCISPDVMKAGMKFLVGAIRDLLAAVKNGNAQK